MPPLAGRVVKFLLRHWPLWLLLIIMGVFAMGTADVYLWSDDLKWVLRTAADASAPLNIFTGSPLFGNYYRPVPHLVWLMNYYIWGLDFGGHQFMFILMWLLGAALVYAVGCRLYGRWAGAIAASIIGLNDIYLSMSSWKSWYTSITEFCAVLAWAAVFLRWLDDRRKGLLAGWIGLGILAVLCRELAPLIISAGIFVSAVMPLFWSGTKWRALGYTILWAAISIVVVMVHPAYRAQLGIAGNAAAGAVDAFSFGFAWERFVSHTRSMFIGSSKYLFLLASIIAISRHLPKTISKRALLGGSVAALVVIGLLGFKQPADAIVTILFFLIASALGDRNDRLLGAWFLMSFAPILFLEHKSNAYHLLALTALALFAARWAAQFLAVEGAAAREFMRGRRARHDLEAQYAIALLLGLCLLGQAVMLVRGFQKAGPLIAYRAGSGRQMRKLVDLVVTQASQSFSDKQAWVDLDQREAMVAGLILQETHGFDVRILTEPEWVGLRETNLPLRVYSGAVEYDKEIFSSLSIVSDPGFENAEPSARIVDIAHTGAKSVTSKSVSTTFEDLFVATSRFNLPAGAYLFGSFIKMDAKKVFDVRSALRVEGPKPMTFNSRHIPLDATDWRLTWECANLREDAGDVIFFPIAASQAQHGRVLADDVFLCRVGDVKEKGKIPAEAKNLREFWKSGQ